MSRRDRAAELWKTKDLWPEISRHLSDAARDAAEASRHFALDLDDFLGLRLERELRDKFAAGEAEHGRDWLHMTRDELLAEIRAELMDLVLYHAMIRARWVDEPDFVCHVDPGDEQS